MSPDYIEELADIADPDKLWRLNWMDQKALPVEKRQQLDSGVALRRHASHLRQLHRLREEGKSLLITPLSPNSTATISVDPPEKHQRLLNLRAAHIVKDAQ